MPFASPVVWTKKRWHNSAREKKISLLVDAAHPFAIRLHRTLAKVSSRLRIPVVRLERQYPAHDKRFDMVHGLCRRHRPPTCGRDLQPIGPDRRQDHCETASLLGADALLVPYPEPERVLFRWLNPTDSQRNGLFFFHEGEDEKKLLDQLHPDAVLTKESGESG